jgi:mannosidase alpha-like ER degradation enhancer 2
MKQLCTAFAAIIIASSSRSQETLKPVNADSMTTEVRSEFLHCWNGYKKYAWGHDDLKPLSKSFRDWHTEPLYMTAVDALDALLLMGLKAEADSTIEFLAANLSFDKDIEVKNFEITIRILGGLLSSFEMTRDQRLLEKAVDLGYRLMPVFESNTGMPYMYVNLKTGKVRGEISNPAEIGTLLIEFGTLARLSNHQEFYDKAKKALVELYHRRSPLGLVGSRINVNTGEWVDSSSHLSGGIDSYYEYLLKSAFLFGDTTFMYMWNQSLGAINKHLARDTSTGSWYGVVNMYTGRRVDSYTGALDAFFPAVLTLSGDLDRAAKCQESFFRMWNKFGIEPEGMNFATMQVVYPGYPLRPEIIESAYYLWYFTRDEQYRRMGQAMFDSLKTYCRTEVGYAALKDVTTKEKADEMESFFLAETLKYLYLLFAPPETLNLTTSVFNTEAHPMMRQ